MQKQVYEPDTLNMEMESKNTAKNFDGILEKLLKKLFFYLKLRNE